MKVGKPNRIRAVRVGLQLLFLALLGTGCVYFNTMFNAKRDFDRAKNLEKKRLETRSSSIISLDEDNFYKGVVRRCAKVLAEYPDSKWVDDALFLMGNAYFERGIYDSAGYKYDELLSYYPNSEWSDDAYFIKGRALLSREQYTEADSIFNRIASELADSDFADDARLMLAESAFRRNVLDSARVNFEILIRDYPESALIHQARQGLGDCYYREADYEASLAAYHELISGGKPAKAIWFHGVHRVGRCLLELERTDEAALHLQRVRKERLSPSQEAWIDIDLARVQSDRGNHQEALEALNEITRKQSKTEIAAEAAFRAGTIYQDKLDSLETAGRMYDRARKEAPQSTAATEALIRTTGLSKLSAASGTGVDSTGQAARNQFILAELYYFRLNDIPKAMTEYRNVVEDYPGSYWAANALYAMAHLAESVQRDREKSEELLDELIRDYPSSEFAVFAREKSGLEVSTAEVDSLPRTRYLKAEKALLAGENPEMAVSQLERLAAADPASPYAPRSLLAVAWAREHNGGNPESAMEVYRRIAELYPDFEGAGIARSRVEEYEKQTKAEEARKAREQKAAERQAAPAADKTGTKADPGTATATPDTTAKPTGLQKPAPAESTTVEAPKKKIAGPAELIKKAEPVYPLSVRNAGIEGTVSLNVMIDDEGQVSRVIYLKGPKELTEAAEEAARKSTYEPAYRNSKPTAAFINVNFTFTLPSEPTQTNDSSEPAPAENP
ncbi:TonB family protein [candidate division KSB1 bacterium]